VVTPVSSTKTSLSGYLLHLPAEATTLLLHVGPVPLIGVQGLFLAGQIAAA